MKIYVTFPMIVVGILRAIKCRYSVPVIVGFAIVAKAFSVRGPLLAARRAIPAGTSHAVGIRMIQTDRVVIQACHCLSGTKAARGFVMESVMMYWLQNSSAWNMDMPARLRSHVCECVELKP